MNTAKIILFAVIGFIVILWLAKVTFRFREFKSQLNYINTEIARASERSLPHWKKRRRKLWLYYLLRPF